MKHIRLGVPRHAAATLAGWSPRAFDNYLHDGKAARAEGRFADPKARFAADVMLAEAQCKRGALAIIWKAARGSPAVLDEDGNIVTPGIEADWRAAVWMLERRFPLQFGPRAGRIAREADLPEAPISTSSLMEGVASARRGHLRVVPDDGPKTS